MKKNLLIVFIALIILCVGAYIYFTRQIAEPVDELATMLRPMGQLSYDNVHLTPGGQARINNLRYRPNGSNETYTIERVAVRSSNLWALYGLQREFDNERLPGAMGLSIEGATLPTNSPALSFLSSQGSDGGLFDATGCGDRTHFSGWDLNDMGYLDLTFDLDMDYQLDNRGQTLTADMRSRTRDHSQLHIEMQVNLGAGSRNLQDVFMAGSRARLESLVLTFDDLGFYPRMLAFCAEEEGMNAADYIAHHFSAWSRQWDDLGVEPGEQTLLAYRQFLEKPEQLQLRLDPPGGMTFNRLQRMNMAGILEHARPTLRVNYGSPEPLTLVRRQQEPESEMESETTPVATDEGLPEPIQDTAAGLAGSGEPPSAPEAESDEPEIPRASRPPAWQVVSPGELQGHERDRVDLTMADGERVFGRIDRVESGHIHVQVQGPGGYYIRPFVLSEVREARVRR